MSNEPSYHRIGYIEHYGTNIRDMPKGKQNVPVYVRAHEYLAAATPTPPAEPALYLHADVFDHAGKVKPGNALTWADKPTWAWTVPLYKAPPEPAVRHLREAWATLVNLSADMEAGPLKQQMQRRASSLRKYLDSLEHADGSYLASPGDHPSCKSSDYRKGWNDARRDLKELEPAPSTYKVGYSDGFEDARKAFGGRKADHG